MKNELETIKKEVEAFNYVSFDIFDTLLFRTVPDYTDMYSLIQLKYEEQFGVLKTDFKKERIKAEAQARRSRYPKEVTLDYIYSFLPYDTEISNRFKRIEIESEIACCVPNAPMIELLHWCKQQNKKIIIITDMYLDRDTINAILSKINVFYDKLFISNEAGETKRTGKLFEIVLNDLNIKPQELIHIGDDANNDILMPKSVGIKAIERIQTISLSQTPLKDSVLTKHIVSLYDLSCDKTEPTNHLKKFAYCTLGPMSLDFCQWIHDKKIELGIEQVLFIAREGFLLKQCYDILYPNERNDVKYVRLNKNLLRLPLLNFEDPISEFIRSIPSRITMTWDEILKNFFIEDIKSYKKILADNFKELDINRPFAQETLTSNTLENHVLTFILETQKEKINEQYELLDKYLLDIGIYSKKTALVNNSINGSGQAMIEDYAKKSQRQCNIVGLQFVKSALCHERLANRCHAWITDHKFPRSYTFYYGYGNLILEHLLFESKGTALFFSKRANDIEIICEKQGGEEKNNDLITQLHKFVKDFVGQYKNCLNLHLNYIGAQTFKNWLKAPDSETANLFCKLIDEDNDGEKQIADLSISIPNYVALKRYIPDSIKWYPGYFSAKRVHKIWLWIYNLRFFIKYTIKKF